MSNVFLNIGSLIFLCIVPLALLGVMIFIMQKEKGNNQGYRRRNFDQSE